MSGGAVGGAAAAEEDEQTDDVPDLDFEGVSFRTIEQNQTKYGFYTDAENGDSVNDVLYRRIRDAEERLNIRFAETKYMTCSEVAKQLKETVYSDSDDFDLIMNQIFLSGSSAVSDLLYNWNEVPYVDLPIRNNYDKL